MPTSLSQSQSITCPQCSEAFEADTWLIVDSSERPDLMEKIRNKTLYTLSCPKCGSQWEQNSSLLVFRPDKTPHIFYAPARNVTRRDFQREAALLVERLRSSLEAGWQDEWEQSMQTTSHRFLSASLSDDKEESLQKQAQAEIEHLQREDPEAFQQLAQIFQTTTFDPTLLQQVQSFIKATTWEETRQVLEQNSRVLSEEGQVLLEGMLRVAELQQDNIGTNLLNSRLVILRVCRKAGVEQGIELLTRTKEIAERIEEVPSAERDELERTILTFVDAKIWEKYELVIRRPELLSDLTNDMLFLFIGKTLDDDDESLRLAFERNRTLLSRCREVGIEKGFSEAIFPSGQVEKPISAILLRNTLKLMDLYDGMSTEYSDETLNTLQREVTADIDQLHVVDPEGYQVFLDLAQGAYESTPELKIIEVLIQMNSWIEQKLLLERRPELLSDRTEFVLRIMIDQAKSQGFGEFQVRIEERYSLIRHCREIGIHQAFEEKALREDVPDEMRRMYQALNSLPENQKIPLSEIFISAESPDDLSAKLEAHPELSNALAEVMQIDTGQSPVKKYQADFFEAKDAEREHGISRSLLTLDQAISAYTRILIDSDFTTSPLDFQKIVLNDSSINFMRRFIMAGRKSDLDQAILLMEQVVTLIPPDSDGYSLCLMNLSTGLRERYRFFGSSEDLNDVNRAIALSKRALEREEIKPDELPSLLGSLVGGLMDRYDSSSMRSDLEEAIEKCKQALEICPSDTPEYLALLNNMGVCLKTRYDRYGDITDLNDAINNYRKVVSLREKGTDKAMALSNLGNALRSRFRHSVSPKDLADAIKAHSEAVSLFPDSSPDISVSLSNLATSLMDRYDFEKNREDLLLAIASIDKAIERTKQRTDSNTIQYLSLLINRGLALDSLFQQSNDLADINSAIESFHHALEIAPESYIEFPGLLLNLGNALKKRHERLGVSVDLEDGVKAYSEAYQKARGVSPQVTLSISRQWGSWALHRAAWGEAIEAYTYGIEAIDQLVKAQLLFQQKEAWLTEVRGIFTGCAYALAKIGDLDQAVEVLERGRARMLSEILARERIDLEAISSSHPELLSRYREAVSTLANNRRSELRRNEEKEESETFLEERQQSRLALIELDRAIDEIRQIEGYQNFLEPFTIAQIYQLAQQTPLIYLAVTPVGGLALIVLPHKDIVPIWLKDLSDNTLDEHIWDRNGARPGSTTYVGSYSAWRRNSLDDVATGQWNNTLDSTLRWLWDALMGSITDVLSNLNITRVTLIPQGVLGLLPLHAAWVEDKSRSLLRRYAMDVITYSYAPNAQCLAASLSAVHQVSGFELLFVNSFKDQVISSLEIAGAVACFGKEHSLILDGQQAVANTILESLSSHSVLHFSTHGYVDMRNPRNSGLELSNGENLTLNHFLSAQLRNTRLAILSACESAMPGDPHLLDEVLSLPAGLVQAGVAGVIGTLWLVYVTDAVLFTSRFYDYWKNEGIDPVESLRQTQVWLRDTMNGEKRKYFRKKLPEYGALFDLIIPESENLHSFADPIHWAAFTYNGI